MKCGFAVSFSSHEVAPERSQPALNSGLEMATRRHGQLGYSVNTGGRSRGTEALRGAASGSLRLRRLSCSGSAAMPAIVPSLACASGSGGQQQATVGCRVREHPAARLNSIAPVRVSIQTALPNPSLKRSANGSARWSSSAGPLAHCALAAQRTLPLSPA